MTFNYFPYSFTFETIQFQLGLNTMYTPREETVATLGNQTLVIDGDVEEDLEQENFEAEIEEFCFGGWGWCPSMPSTMHMVYRAGYDDRFLAKLGGSKSAAENYIKQAMTHATPAFCAPGLGTKISLQRDGAIKHYAGYAWDSSK